jgi:N-formylmaleamate deformylase
MKKINFLIAFAVVIISGQTSYSQSVEKFESFNVKVSGHGDPIFFIPGILCSGDVWNETVKYYEKKYTCYVFTLAGFAGATPLKSDKLMPKIKDDLIGYIKMHSKSNAILVGHSMGGFYGLLIASSEPTLLKHLVVVDALPFLMGAQDSTRTEEQVQLMVKGSEKAYENIDEKTLRTQQLSILSTMITDKAKIEKACDWSMASDRLTMGKSFAEMMGTDLREKIKSIKTKTLVMVAWDKPIPAYPLYTKEASLNVFASQYKNLNGVELKQTEGSKHFIMYDQPEWFISTLNEFMKN